MSDEVFCLVQSDAERACGLLFCPMIREVVNVLSLLSHFHNFRIIAVMIMIKGLSLVLDGLWKCTDGGLDGPDMDSVVTYIGILTGGVTGGFSSTRDHMLRTSCR